MAIYEYQSALQSVQRSLREVVDMEDTDEEKNNLNAIHDSVKIVEELYHNFGGCMRNLTDSLRFFGQPCMESAQSLIDRCGAHDPMSDSSVDIIAAMAQEWTFFREHRQCELQTYVVECGTRMREEVCRVIFTSRCLRTYLLLSNVLLLVEANKESVAR